MEQVNKCIYCDGKYCANRAIPESELEAVHAFMFRLRKTKQFGANSYNLKHVIQAKGEIYISGCTVVGVAKQQGFEVERVHATSPNWFINCSIKDAKAL